MNKIVFQFILCFLLFITCLVFTFAGEIPAKAQDHTIALVGGTIHTISGSTISNGTIVFDNGKITAVGDTINIPQDAERIDITGKDVYPGMIDPRSTLGITEIDAVRASNDVAEVGSINPNIRAEVAINPDNEIIPVTRANGVTMALTAPDGGLISGTAALIELDGWTWEDMTFKSQAGLIINWPSMTINHAWWERRSEEDQKKDRDKSLEQIRNAFHDARAYLQAKNAETDKEIPYHKTDVRWEAMKPFITGNAPILIKADDIQQIEAAVAWADHEGIKINIMGGYDSWRVADLLKARNIPVVAGPIITLPWRRSEAYDEPMTLPKKLYEAGVKFCIAGDCGASNERNLPYHAAMAASYGLPKDEAIKAITLYTAQIFGVDNRVGSLEVGKDATLIVTNGDPLELKTNVQLEFIEGKNIPLTNKQTRLYEKYKEKYQRMKIGNFK